MTKEELFLYQQKISEAECMQREIYDTVIALRKLNLSADCQVLIRAGNVGDLLNVNVRIAPAFRERVIALLTDQLAGQEKEFADFSIDLPHEKKEVEP